MNMNDIDGALNDIMSLNGAIATSLIDWESGMTLGTASNGEFEIELASAGNTEVIKAKMATMQSIGLGTSAIKDIMITLDQQNHIIMMVPNHPELCLYGAFDNSSNLALARNKMQSVAKA